MTHGAGDNYNVLRELYNAAFELLTLAVQTGQGQDAAEREYRRCRDALCAYILSAEQPADHAVYEPARYPPRFAAA